MNNPNPFVPKGSLLDQQSQRRSRLKIFVGCILAVSIVGLVAMLIQGCKREQPQDNQPVPDNNPPAVDNTNVPPVTPDTNQANQGIQMPPPVAPTNAVVTPPPPQPQPQPPVEQTAGSTYEIVAGDTLAKIAKAHGVKLSVLVAANPGVDPKKLKIKQKLNIPAGTTSPDTAGGATGATAAPAADVSPGGESYTVKSGDTLTKIAKKYGIKVKALKAANASLAATDHIKVGQKLTIPAKSESAAPAADAAAVPSMPPPASAPAMPAPAPAPAAAPAPGH